MKETLTEMNKTTGVSITGLRLRLRRKITSETLTLKTLNYTILFTFLSAQLCVYKQKQILYC